MQILPRSEREDVIREFESHVYEQEQIGRIPADILSRLGKPESYARSYLEQYSDRLRNQGSLPEHARFMFRQAIWPVLIVSLAFVALMQANALFIWWDLVVNGEAPLWIVPQMMLMGLPAIFVVLLPSTTLFMVPLYIYRIRGTQARYTLRSAKVWLITLITGVLLSVVGLGVQEWIVPVTNTRTVELLETLLHERSETQTQSGQLRKTEFKDVRQMTAAQAYQYLSHKANASRGDFIAYYQKFSLPLGALAFALYGLLTASLMLSGLFHPRYTLIVIGFVIPFGGYLMLHSLVLSERFSPLLNAFLPDLVMVAISLVFLLGMLMQLPKTAQERHERDTSFNPL